MQEGIVVCGIWDGREVKVEGKIVSEGIGNRPGLEVAEEGMTMEIFSAQG